MLSGFSKPHLRHFISSLPIHEESRPSIFRGICYYLINDEIVFDQLPDYAPRAKVPHNYLKTELALV